MRLFDTSGPDGIRALPPHQVFGLAMGPRPRQVSGNAGVTFLPSLELYLRNSLLTLFALSCFTVRLTSVVMFDLKLTSWPF